MTPIEVYKQNRAARAAAYDELCEATRLREQAELNLQRAREKHERARLESSRAYEVAYPNALRVGVTQIARGAR